MRPLERLSYGPPHPHPHPPEIHTMKPSAAAPSGTRTQRPDGHYLRNLQLLRLAGVPKKKKKKKKKKEKKGGKGVHQRWRSIKLKPCNSLQLACKWH
jgi:hypothetical protein